MTTIVPQFRGTAEQGPRLDDAANFPGWSKAQALLKMEISARNLKEVCDIGGGANPLLNAAFIRSNAIDYAVLDISQSELDKAPDEYNKIQVDVGAPLNEFCARVGKARFDLVFTHMFLEHVEDPICVHQNIHAALRPGGLAIHFYPSPGNLPLVVNRLLPDTITRPLLRMAQPKRDMEGRQVKFPVFYAMCGGPSPALHAKFGKIGYDVLRHTGYIGHWYYDRFSVTRKLERAARVLLLKARIPLISYCLLILRKR